MYLNWKEYIDGYPDVPFQKDPDYKVWKREFLQQIAVKPLQD